jgi:hypothetical protein
MNSNLESVVAQFSDQDKTALLARLLRELVQRYGDGAMTIRDEAGSVVGEFLPSSGPSSDDPVATPEFLREIVERPYSDEPAMPLEEFLALLRKEALDRSEGKPPE